MTGANRVCNHQTAVAVMNVTGDRPDRKEQAMSRAIASCVAVVMIAGLIGTPAGWAQTTKGAGPATKPAQAEKAAGKMEKVDLNSATQQELEALPEVGPVTAKKIIAGRPYASVQDLSKAGVSAKTIEKISPMVVAGGAAAAPASPARSVSPAPQKPATAKSSESAKSESVEAKVPPAKGMVWVNTKSGVFHHEGDRWYGKTKDGKFMTEGDALKAGYRAAKEGVAKKESAAKQ